MGRRFLDIPIDEAVQANNRLFFIKLCSKVFNLHPKRLKTHGLPRIPTHRVGQGELVVYQYTQNTSLLKIPSNTLNSSKYTENYTQVYFIPEIQRK